MYGIVYGVVCITLANLMYKPRRMKAMIEKSPGFAVFVSAWLLLFSILLWYPSRISVPVNYSVLPVFILTSVCWFASPWIVRRFGKKPEQISGDVGKTFLVDFRWYTYLTKYFEILCQQALFVYVLFVILGGITDLLRLVWFLIFILIIHLANIFFMDKKHALLFTYLSIPMAIGFEYLILHGYVLVTASLHMIFYLLLNGRYWFTRSEII